MAGVERLIRALQEVAVPSDDLPTLCDFGQILKKFFSRPDIQELMVKMNQTQLYDMMESRNGTRLGTYAEKTLKHKIRHNRPYPYYSYYETGKTHESLEVFAEDEFVMIAPGQDAPEYAIKNLDAIAWGLNDEHFEELMPEIKEAVVNEIRDFLTNG